MWHLQIGNISQKCCSANKNKIAPINSLSASPLCTQQNVFLGLFSLSEWQLPSSVLSSLWVVCQPCLFWMTDAIYLCISWWFNLYFITLPKQNHLGWDSQGLIIHSGPVISCTSTLVQHPLTTQYSSKCNKSFLPDATTLKDLIPFCTLICLLFIFISFPSPKSVSPSLSVFAFIHFFSGAALKQALLVWFTFY